MVAALHVGQDLRPDDPVPQPVGDEKIVDAPPRVVLPGVEAVGPPGVGPLPVRIEVPEGVCKPGGQQGGHFFPLLVGEAGVAPIGLGVFQVNLLVGHVQVAAVNDRLGPVQGDEVIPQVVLPLHAVVDPLQPVLGVGGVAAYQVEGPVLQSDEPPLVVVGFPVHAVGHGGGSVGGEDGGAGVPLLLGGVPELQNTLPQRDVRLAPLHLGLLETEKVGRSVPVEI